MAEFDPDAFLREQAAPVVQSAAGGFDPDAFLQEHGKKAPPSGKLEAGATGLMSGLTADWNDELTGAAAAGRAGGEGVPKVPVEREGLFDTPLGLARLAHEHWTGQPGEATAAYNRTVEAMRARQKQLKEEHPYVSGAGHLVGAGAGMVMAPGSRALTVPGKIGEAAGIGAGFGALSGAGESEGGLGETAKGAGYGAGTGSIAGPIGLGVGKLIEKAGKLAWDYTGKPIAGVVRGLLDADKEGTKRMAGAIAADAPQIAASKAQGMTPQQWTEAYERGEPVILADMGAETTRAVLRSASNSSPAARNEINSVLQDRFQTQADRAGATIRSLVSGGANSLKSKAALEAEYEAERGAAYGTAYAAGERPIWSPELERLTSAPSVQTALRGAVNTWRDWQVRDGYGAMNPPVQVTPDGMLKFLPGNGLLPYPNLQLWDYAARNLASWASMARNAGNTAEASRIGGLEKQLKAELDRMVPQFKDARGVAATFFGGNNAIEAGEIAVNAKNIGELKMAMAKMKPAEREMFQESFADKWARNIEGTADNRDVTGKLMFSRLDRQRVEAVLGPQAAQTMNAFRQRELIYDSARKAMGNSTTVRQMIEAGLAGGAVGGYLSDWDPKHMTAGATALGLSRAGGQRLIGYVDQNVARRVAEMLTSDDPHILMRGLRLATSNKRIAAGLQDVAEKASIQAAARESPKIPLQSPGNSTAEEGEGDIPRPPSQKNNGGRVEGENNFANGGRVHRGLKIMKDNADRSRAMTCS